MGGLDEFKNDETDDNEDEADDDCSLSVISGVLLELRPLFNSFNDWFVVVDCGLGEDEAATEFILVLLILLLW